MKTEWVEFKYLLKISDIPSRSIFKSLFIGILITPIAFSFFAIEVFVLAQFSIESAASLWSFEQQNILIERNHKLGSNLLIFVTFAFVHALIIPLVEEITFRGVLLFYLNKKYNSFIAALISSLLFMLIHPIGMYLDTFIFAICACFITLKTGRIIFSYIIHASYNLLSWLLEGFNITLFFTNKNSGELNEFLTWSTEFSLLILLIIPISILLNRLITTYHD